MVFVKLTVEIIFQSLENCVYVINYQFDNNLIRDYVVRIGCYTYIIIEWWKSGDRISVIVFIKIENDKKWRKAISHCIKHRRKDGGDKTISLTIESSVLGKTTENKPKEKLQC